MRALITGGGGFVGQWLARALLARGDEVILTGLGATLAGPNILTRDERRHTRWMAADMRDAEDVELVVQRSRANVIVHLAGVSFPPDAERSPTTTYDVNALGAVRLLSAVRRQQAAGLGDPTVLIVGSGMQYGNHPLDAMPLTEQAEQRPTTTYAASKAAQELAALQVHASAGVRVIVTRSFNHSGVGHGEQYLLPSLVMRARRIAEGAEGRLVLGNDVVRDYLHVDDVVTAYLSLVDRGRPGEVYNVASGCGISVRQLAEAVLERAHVTAEITTDPSLTRAADIPLLIGSPTKLCAHTGWAPTKTHGDIIDDLLRFAHASTD
ncbi:MAG TPA: GDP-mannose 4,6-dehydratase [Gemmatimonadaceae bacterium]|jgi:GDP-4-dehydro-6-deoxy-D-mannose reductase|nr:GDP-mannose 4,6-dehydratase [Gemmatimonadaceae bacterium]